eukprot:scaffold156869_cov50-Attheya_sp.AAC.1
MYAWNVARFSQLLLPVQGWYVFPQPASMRAISVVGRWMKKETFSKRWTVDGVVGREIQSRIDFGIHNCVRRTSVNHSILQSLEECCDWVNKVLSMVSPALVCYNKIAVLEGVMMALLWVSWRVSLPIMVGIKVLVMNGHPDESRTLAALSFFDGGDSMVVEEITRDC